VLGLKVGRQLVVSRQWSIQSSSASYMDNSQAQRQALRTGTSLNDLLLDERWRSRGQEDWARIKRPRDQLSKQEALEESQRNERLDLLDQQARDRARAR
jgi:hypothetical protein